MLRSKRRVLKLRNKDLSLSSAAAPPSQMNLLAAGTARLLGGEEAASQVVERTSQTLNFTGHNAFDIMTLCERQKARDLGQHRAHNASQSTRLTQEDLANIYGKAKRLTANVVFGSGNGQLGTALFKEVRRRTLNKMQQDTEKLERTKKRLRILIKRAAEIRKAEKDYKKWKNAQIKDMIRYKKNSGNKWKIPTLKAEMQKKWLVVRNNTTPHVSLSNSDGEESLGGDDESYSSELDAEDVEEGLVFEGEEEEDEHSS